MPNPAAAQKLWSALWGGAVSRQSRLSAQVAGRVVERLEVLTEERVPPQGQELYSSAVQTAGELYRKAKARWGRVRSKPAFGAVAGMGLLGIYLADSLVTSLEHVPVGSACMELVGLGVTLQWGLKWLNRDQRRSMQSSLAYVLDEMGF